MRTYIFEGKVTALSSISHNSDELNGNMAMLRREKFVQPDGSIAEPFIISGNAVRGILRDRGMLHMLSELGYGIDENGKINGIPLQSYYFFFSGGSLTSGGATYDAEYYRSLKQVIPLISLFGGAVGNEIISGSMNIGKLIPICEETAHLIPEEYRKENAASCWDYVQTEMYTRRDDKKNDKLRKLLHEPKDSLLVSDKKSKDAPPQQMIYHVETVAAGTEFYWRVVLNDVTDIEYEAFCTTLAVFGFNPVIGGKGGTGLGRIKIKFDKITVVDNNTSVGESEVDVRFGEKYKQHLEVNADAIRELINEID